MDWIPCTDQMPSTVDPKDPTGTRVVLAACAPDSREEGLLQVDIMNAVWFINHWQKGRYSHWMYCPDPPYAEDPIQTAKDVHAAEVLIKARAAVEAKAGAELREYERLRQKFENI